MVTADFNLDLKPDLAITDCDDNVVRILLGTGKGSFREPHQFRRRNGPHCVKVFDFNYYDKPDLAVANYISTGGVLSNRYWRHGERHDRLSGQPYFDCSR